MMFGEDELIRSHKDRAGTVSQLVFVAFALVLARLWYLQIYKGKILYNYSLQNRLRSEIVKAPRGMIFGRDNQMFVNNIPRFDAIIIPQYLTNKKDTLWRLSKILSMDEQEIKKILLKYSTQASYRPIIIKKNLSWPELSRIETENFRMPGVSVDAFISREYTYKDVGSHLLGYISEVSQGQLPKLRRRDQFQYRLGDTVGQSGLEEQLDLIIRGSDGHEFVEVDALGRKKRHINIDNFFKGVENKVSVPGKNIRLTIDKDLQLAAYEALEGKVGGAVALDVNTGEVLAMVSRPGFDPSQFSRGLSGDYWTELISDPQRPLRDHTIQDHYPPGSTFKIFTAIAALEEGYVDEHTEVSCTGSFKFGKRTSHCWQKHGHGSVDIYKSIRESCDIYYYKIATRMDVDILAKYAKMFGLGKLTGIDMPREAPGLIPSTEWKLSRFGQEWIKGETLSCVIGQSYVLSTPLQLALAYSAIANNGKLYRPLVVKEIFSNSGEIETKFESSSMTPVPVSEKTFRIIKEALYQVANNPKGTAYGHRGRGIDMSGKTGTSQVMRFSSDKIYTKCIEHEYKNRHHGLFVGYAPRDNPQISAAAVVEHGCSSSKAVPIVESILMTYMKKYHPKTMEEIIKREEKNARRPKPVDAAPAVKPTEELED